MCVKWPLVMVLICVSLMIKDFEHFFHVLIKDINDYLFFLFFLFFCRGNVYLCILCIKK